mgnify:CR=1 FL=1
MNNKRTPEELEIMKKGLICDDNPLPNFKKKKTEKTPPFPDKDLDKLYKDVDSGLMPEIDSDSLKKFWENQKKGS